jgi:hypothetical protein
MAAYLLMCALVIVGFWSIANSLERVERETVRALRAECEISLSSRQLLRSLVENVGLPPEEIPEDAPDSLREVVEASNRRRDEFRVMALEKLGPVLTCEDILRGTLADPELHPKYADERPAVEDVLP